MSSVNICTVDKALFLKSAQTGGIIVASIKGARLNHCRMCWLGSVGGCAVAAHEKQYSIHNVCEQYVGFMFLLSIDFIFFKVMCRGFCMSRFCGQALRRLLAHCMLPSASMAPKRPRPTNDMFCTESLYESLNTFAALKKSEWDFELERYSSSRREDPIDLKELARYEPHLAAILRHAPGCYPSKSQLKVVLSRLDEEFSIKSPALAARIEKKHDMWCEYVADRVRICTKHVLQLFEAQSPYLSHPIKNLVKLVHAQPTRKSIRKIMSEADEQRADSVVDSSIASSSRELSRHASNTSEKSAASSIMIVSSTCCCPDCVPQQPDIPTVSAKKGAHKKTVLANKALRRRPSSSATSETVAPVLKKPCGSLSSSSAKFKLVKRFKEPAKRYILVGGRYLWGLSALKTERFIEITDSVFALLVAGELEPTKESCKEHCEMMLSTTVAV